MYTQQKIKAEEFFIEKSQFIHRNTSQRLTDRDILFLRFSFTFRQKVDQTNNYSIYHD